MNGSTTNIPLPYHVGETLHLPSGQCYGITNIIHNLKSGSQDTQNITIYVTQYTPQFPIVWWYKTRYIIIGTSLWSNNTIHFYEDIEKFKNGRMGETVLIDMQDVIKKYLRYHAIRFPNPKFDDDWRSYLVSTTDYLNIIGFLESRDYENDAKMIFHAKKLGIMSELVARRIIQSRIWWII